MARILITGAARGLGLEFTRQLLERGDRVFAGSRNPESAPGLQELKHQYGDQLTLVRLDVSDAESIRQSHEQVRAETDALDVLLNNAGVYGARGSERSAPGFGELNFEDALSVFRVNSIAPMLVAQQYRDLLRAGDNPRIASVSSGLGSISGNTGGFPWDYGASKAALNMYTRSLAAELKEDGITAIVLDPGWVQTDMGGPTAPLTPPESIRGMLRVLDGLTLADTGRFLSWQGEERAW